MAGDILKLARVGTVFQRVVSTVMSCDFALLNCLSLAWITALSVKPSKAVVKEIRCNDCKNK